MVLHQNTLGPFGVNNHSTLYVLRSVPYTTIKEVTRLVLEVTMKARAKLVLEV